MHDGALAHGRVIRGSNDKEVKLPGSFGTTRGYLLSCGSGGEKSRVRFDPRALAW